MAYIKRNSSKDFLQSSLADNKAFEKVQVSNVDITIFLSRLIEIFEVVIMKLDFAVS